MRVLTEHRRLKPLVSSLLVVILAACGSGNGGSPCPDVPPPPEGSLGYSLIGTVNGETADGDLVLLAKPITEPNLVRYDVASFSLGQISGQGTAELSTFDNRLTIQVSACTRGDQLELIGTGHATQATPPFIGIDGFVLGGQGYTLFFSAIPQSQ